MIAPELEMRSIARRGTTREELELKAYAASELQGNPHCLLTEIAKRRERFLREKPAANEQSQGRIAASPAAEA